MLTLSQLCRLDYERAYQAWVRGQCSDGTFARFVALWEMSCPRYSGRAGSRQERFYNRAGYTALERRRARVNRTAERIMSRP